MGITVSNNLVSLQSENYAAIVANHEEEDEDEHEDHDDVDKIIEQQFVQMDPQLPVKLVDESRSTDTHW